MICVGSWGVAKPLARCAPALAALDDDLVNAADIGISETMAIVTPCAGGLV